jgi:hypothetical protein
MNISDVGHQCRDQAALIVIFRLIAGLHSYSRNNAKLADTRPLAHNNTVTSR